jgi:hypothetical protein
VGGNPATQDVVERRPDRFHEQDTGHPGCGVRGWPTQLKMRYALKPVPTRTWMALR